MDVLSVGTASEFSNIYTVAYAYLAVIGCMPAKCGITLDRSIKVVKLLETN